MDGKDYVTHWRLTAKDGTVLAEQGETCERVPEASLPWLLEQKLIEPVRQTEA